MAAAIPPVARAGRVLLGLILVILSTLPLYRYADRPAAGMAGGAVVQRVAAHAELMWSGALVLVLAGVVAGLMTTSTAWDRAVAWVAGWIRRPSSLAWALGLAAISFGITLWFTVVILEGKPNLIDAMAQLVQARYMAAGMAAGPVVEGREFWAFQNMVFTDAGWVTHFPPGHSAWLALFLRAGLLEFSGAAVMAVTAAFTYLTLRRLVPGREVAARLGGIAIAAGPFLLSHAGSYMNHGPAAALGVLAIYSALRARDGRAAWMLASGAVLGALFATRPLFAVVTGLGVVVPIGVSAWRVIGGGGFAWRAVLTLVGASPFLAALLTYNHRFFGNPFVLGYQVTGGPAVGLGFHVDPWGNVYSPAMAVALTSADLTSLNLALLEIPLPLVAFVGLWLIARRRLPDGGGLLAAWALVPVVAQFFYWHHGHFMGPRLLSDAAPAWAGLTTLALIELVRMAPTSLPRLPVRFAPRPALISTLALGVLAAGYLAPLRLVHRGADFMRSMRLEAATANGATLVFVHGAWSARVFARMVAREYSLHEIETALRQNGLCMVYQALDRPSGDLLGTLDMEPRAVNPQVIELEPFRDNRIVLGRDAVTATGQIQLAPGCRDELMADRYGIMEVAVYYWQGDLPGLGGNGPMYVRDMGPAMNRELIARHPDRTPYVLARREIRRGPVLLPYESGMDRIWGHVVETP